MEIPNWLARQAGLRPNELALVAGETRLSWAQLEQQAQDIARKIAGLGIGVGDRVALLMGNGGDFVLFVHALIKLGVTLAPLNIRLTPAELAWQTSDCGAKLLVYDAQHREQATELAQANAELQTLAAQEVGDLAPDNTVSLLQRIDLDATHCIVYTSGTTGQPKGALITYSNDWWSATASALNLGNMASDRWLAILPLFHVGGMAILLRSAIYGVPAIVHTRFDAATVNQAIDEEGVTIISVVANTLQRMLDERGDRPYPPTLRCLLLGGGPAPLPLLERCAERNLPVAQTYGLTESASQFATLAPADALRKIGSAGQALLPNEIRIDIDGEEAPVGGVGEIVVRGPSVTPGYWNRPNETAKALHGGWLHTGDLGHIDAEGYLYVLDRRDDLIISGGENVYPAEVEAVLLSYPGVIEAGVIGQQDEHWGQVPVAFICAAPDVALDPADLIAFSKTRLARYKVPARVDISAVPLPRNAAGKLLRRELRKEASKES